MSSGFQQLIEQLFGSCKPASWPQQTFLEWFLLRKICHGFPKSWDVFPGFFVPDFFVLIRPGPPCEWRKHFPLRSFKVSFSHLRILRGRNLPNATPPKGRNGGESSLKAHYFQLRVGNWGEYISFRFPNDKKIHQKCHLMVVTNQQLQVLRSKQRQINALLSRVEAGKWWLLMLLILGIWSYPQCEI